MADSTHVLPLTTKQFLENIRPFCEQLAEAWPDVPQRLRRRFLRELMNVLGIWFQKAHVESAPLRKAAVSAVNLLERVKGAAMCLRADIKNLSEPGSSETAQSWEFSVACRFVARNLECAGQATTPPWDINSILAALSAIIEITDNPMTDIEAILPDKPGATRLKMELDRFIRVPISYRHQGGRGRPAERRQGRPSGFYRFPNLDVLVFGLGVVAARAGVNLTAYTKSGGRVKVAAGSLIQILEMLRECLLEQLDWHPNLPSAKDHKRHIATYQRLLARARSNLARSWA